MHTLPIRTIATALAFLALSCGADADNYGAVATLPALDVGIAQRRAAIDAHRDDGCNGVAKLLDMMVDVDQFARYSVFAICPSADWKCISNAAERVLSIDADNLRLLKPIIARYSWHELKMCGGKDAQHHV